MNAEERQIQIVILSGEGDRGTFESYAGKDTLRAIRARLTRERCGGDRWARAYRYMHETETGPVYREIDGDDMRIIPADEIK